jgi:phage gp36-like protein
MPDYTTVTKVTDLFPKISDTNISSASIAFYIDQAEAEINGKIAVRYTLPFSLTPPLVETIATELSVIKILDRFFTSEAKSKNDWRDIRKKDLNGLLGGIAEGKITLINSANEIIGQRTDIQDIYSDTKDYTPTFSHLHYSLQEVDEDRLDSEEDDLD